MLRAILFVFLTIIPAGTAHAEETIKIACIGDSITFGATIPNRHRLSYPAQLSTRLGPTYDVRNFGVSGSTMLSKGNLPYVQTKPYQNALKWNPDIVVLMLGTNDSKPINSKHRQKFFGDTIQLIESFQELQSSPRVLLCIPPPVFKDNSIRNAPIREEITPTLYKAAISAGVEIINFTPFLIEHSDRFPDGIHPNPLGAEIIATRIADILQAHRASPIRLPETDPKPKTQNFHGHQMVTFEFNDASAHIVRPHRPAVGHPWIWRARFWGHQPQFDIAMLELGWHIAYIDVSNLYGSPTAIERWNQFHQLLTDAGLSSKPVIEGMSRGGLIAHNWAAAHPKKAAGIYADNPVMDVKSWPMGRPGKESPGDIKRMLAAYGFDSATDAERWDKNPLNQIDKLASAKLPIFYVIGERDEVVPPAANAEIAIAHYEANGGPVQVIRKPQAGHHPHSLADPSPLIYWALRCAGTPMNPAAQPKPSAEFRGQSAGWGGGIWWDQFDRINQIAADHSDLELVFLGDSISQSWTGPHHRLATATGKRAIDRHFGSQWKTASFGISGDRTEHLLYRINHGNFDHISPKVIVLTIGVNNLITGNHTPQQVAEGIHTTVDALRAKCPNSQILLLGPLPSGQHPTDVRRSHIRTIHQLIAPLAMQPKVTYLDITETFTLPDGTLAPTLFSGDFIHLKPAGYEAWAKAIRSNVQHLMR